MAAATLSTSHSFWISDSFGEEDADHENAFHILFGPTSYLKPLDFNPEELEMFEQNSQDMRSSKSKVVIPEAAPKTNTVWREHGNHFQNILDFIDEMTDGNRKIRNNNCVSGVKTSTCQLQGKHTNGDILSNRSADKTSPQTRRHCRDLGLSFCRQTFSEVPGLERCREHRNDNGCYCLGKSKCYIVERKTREVDCLASKEIESISSGETLSTEI